MRQLRKTLYGEGGDENADYYCYCYYCEMDLICLITSTVLFTTTVTPFTATSIMTISIEPCPPPLLWPLHYNADIRQTSSTQYG
jgi:hypothetical protein